MPARECSYAVVSSFSVIRGVPSRVPAESGYKFQFLEFGLRSRIDLFRFLEIEFQDATYPHTACDVAVGSPIRRGRFDKPPGPGVFSDL